MRVAVGRNQEDRGFSLLEVFIATVVMAIVLMGLISSITGSFLASAMANKATEAQATARRLLEEACELSYSDMLLLDGNSMITADGIAAKYQVYEAATGLLMVEVEVCRPSGEVSLSDLSGMTMAEFRQLGALDGSRVCFATLSTGLMERAPVTDVTAGP